MHLSSKIGKQTKITKHLVLFTEESCLSKVEYLTLGWSLLESGQTNPIILECDDYSYYLNCNVGFTSVCVCVHKQIAHTHSHIHTHVSS